MVIETVKSAEDGDGTIVRFYEAHNSRGDATLTFAREIDTAEETNMLEERVGDVSVKGNRIALQVRPYGITTLRVRFR